MRIGVLGGSFDPPHLGHAAMAAAAESELGCELVLWVPAGNPWQKAAQTAADVRAHMCELAVAAHSNWQVSYVDIERGGDTYAIDTLKDLAAAWPDAEFIWLLGADASANLNTWHRADELAQSVAFAAFSRGGVLPTHPENFQVRPCASRIPAFSSTAIRMAIAEGAEPTGLEPIVADYIAQVGLYK